MQKSNSCSWLLKDLNVIPRNGFNVMSTFACGGGSSMGYKRAGFTVLAANDIDPEMAYHYKLNINPKHYFLCPIKNLLTLNLPQELYELDILDGSPPCSSFSASGNREKDWGKKKHFREGQAEQVLDDLFFDYLDVVNRLKPKISIAENVKGLVTGNAKGYVKIIFDRYKEIGYKPQLFLLNAADCGVPQTRERVFFVALRNDIDRPKLTLNPRSKWISVSEALSDLQDLTIDEIKYTSFSAMESQWWPLTKPGEKFEAAVIRAGLKPKLFNHRRLHKDRPSATISPGSTMKHWSIPRKMTFREVKRLSSFPDDYWAKTDRIGCYMVGMSVPPKMTEVVANAVLAQWLM